MKYIRDIAEKVNATGENACDLSDAARFLNHLYPNTTEHLFATMAAEGGGFRHYLGTLEHHKGELLRQNLVDNRHIYYTLHEFSNGSRKKVDMVSPRGIQLDQDEGWIDLPIEPTAVVETSSGKFQVIIMCAGLTWEEFEGIQRRLVRDYKADKQAADRNRVFRLPGTRNTKAKYNGQAMAKLISLGPHYTREEVLAAFPLIEEPAKKPRNSKVTGDTKKSPAGGRIDVNDMFSADGKMSGAEVLRGINKIHRSCVMRNSLDLVGIRRDGTTFFLSLKASGKWKALQRAVKDCNASPKQRIKIDRALDELNRVMGATVGLQSELSDVYCPRRNREILANVRMPGDYENDTGKDAITAATFRAIVRGAEKVLRETQRLHARFGVMANIVESDRSGSEVHRLTQDRILAGTHRGSKMRALAMALCDMIMKDGAKTYITTKDRDDLCLQLGMRRGTLETYMSRLRSNGVLSVMPGRHGADNEGRIYWANDLIREASMTKAIAEQEAMNRASDQSVQSPNSTCCASLFADTEQQQSPHSSLDRATFNNAHTNGPPAGRQAHSAQWRNTVDPRFFGGDVRIKSPQEDPCSQIKIDELEVATDWEILPQRYAVSPHQRTAHALRGASHQHTPDHGIVEADLPF